MELEAEVEVLHHTQPVGVGGNVGEAIADTGSLTLVRQHAIEVGVGIAQVQHRILGELQRSVGGVHRDRTVVAKSGRRREVIHRGDVVHAVTAAHHNLRGEGVGEAEAGSNLEKVRVLKTLTLEIVGEDERA